MLCSALENFVYPYLVLNVKLQGGAVFVGTTECPAGPLCPVCVSCPTPWESNDGWMMFGTGVAVGILLLFMGMVAWESAGRYVVYN